MANADPTEFASHDNGRLRTVWLGALAGFFLLALIAGGTPRYGSPFNTALELLSLPIVLVATLLIVDHSLSGTVKAALVICIGIFFLPLLQLIPLPPWIWTALPGRQFVVDAFEAANLPVAWMPLSLSPPATLRSFLSLFPAMAVFLATINLGYRERRLATLGLIGFGIVCVPLGLAQIASGPDSRLRLYEVTNTMSAVGFFANRNHFAALLYSIVPFVAAWMICRIRAPDSERLGWVALIVVIYGIVILGLGMSASRAGIVLAMAAIVASILLTLRNRKRGRKNSASRAVFVAALLGACAVLQFGLAGILGRLQHDPLDDGRFTFAQATLRAAADVFPVGSGIGSFVPFYAMMETAADVGPSYVNHAHNDWLELWLEAGVPGLILAILFLAWFTTATYRTWRQNESGIDGLLARAASIAVALLLAHSLVDYPLRTTALACLFAFACAMCMDPIGGGKMVARKIALRKYWPRDNDREDPQAASSSVAKCPQFRRKESAEEIVVSPLATPNMVSAAMGESCR